jgi:outer membrane protein assembly complex protein YaeT
MLGTDRKAIACFAALTAVVVAVQPLRAQSANPAPIVADVVPRGNRAVSSEQILAQMNTKPGNRFDATLLQDDITKLLATRSFYNVIARQATTSEGKIVIYLDLIEQPNRVQEVEFQGADHVKIDELETITGIRRGGPLSPDANYAACQAILRKYQELGRLYTSVELIEGGKLTDNRVVFRITESPVVKVSSISFVGNQEVASGRLKTQLNSSKALLGFVGGTYNPPMVENDIVKLEEYYRALGFQDVRVDRELVPRSDRTVDLVFHISEGLRYRINDVQISGIKTFSEEELKRLVNTKRGDYFSSQRSASDVKNIRDFYGYTGRPIGIAPAVYQTEVPGELNVHYQVQERPPLTVGQVVIVGNTVTRDNVIRRQIPLQPGQILTLPDVEVGMANLQRLGIFKNEPENGIRPTISILDLESDTTAKDVLVQVEEAPTGSFMVGLGVNSNSGLSGSIVLNERNFDITRIPTSIDDFFAGKAFRGAGQEFRLEAVPGNRFQRYTASFREPFLFDSLFSLGVNGYYFTRGYIEYTEERTGGRINLGRNLNQFWSVNSSVRIEGVNISDLSLFAPPDISNNAGYSTLIGVRGGVKRDSRDSYLRPTNGAVIEAGYEQVFGDYQFPIGTLEMSRYFTTYQRLDGSGRHVLSFRSQTSIAGSEAPVFERFYAGGFQSLRGFAFRGVGPFVNDLNVGGQFSLLNSMEYQVPLLANDQVFAVAFLDSGSVERNVSLRDYRVSAGFGVRLVVPMLGPVPIALDFCFPIVKGPQDQEQIFSFWLGFFN